MIHMKAEISLTPEELKKLIVEALNAQGIDPDSIDFEVKNREMGHPMNSYTESVFERAVIKFTILEK